MQESKITTVKGLLDEAARTYGDHPAICQKAGGEVASKSYAELRSDSMAFGRAMQKLDLPKFHVALVGPTSYEWVAAYLGTAISGGVAVPMDRELPRGDLCDQLDRADVDVLVYDEMYADLAREAQRQCPKIKALLCMQEDGENPSVRRCFTQDAGELDTDVRPEQMCAILFTSGTTGKSKGVMLSHANLIDNVTCIDQNSLHVHKTLTLLPIHHAYCFTCDILLAMYLGATVCINDSIMHLDRNLQLFKPDTILVVPMIAQSMYYKVSQAVKANPGVAPPLVAKAALGGNLTTIYCGGAYLDPKYILGFKELGIEMLQGYGMTECSPRISTNLQWSDKTDSVGKILPGCEVRAVDGEIWVKSPSVMMGYYNNEAATAETMEDGWLKTGDLGYADDEGYLYVTGRMKNLIILSNGENVSPEELENKLSTNPIVGEVLVYEENNAITAEMFPSAEAAKAMGVAEPDPYIRKLVDTLNSEMPPAKRIVNVKIRDTEFEKTTSRKIKRHY